MLAAASRAQRRRVDVVLEREYETRDANRRPRLRTRGVQRPCEARLVLSEPAGIRPRGHVADQLEPALDDRVLLQLGVRQIAQRLGREEQGWQLVAEPREVALDGRDRLLPGRRDVAAPEESPGAYPVGMPDRDRLRDPTAHGVADERGTLEPQVVAQPERVGDEVGDGVGSGRRRRRLHPAVIEGHDAVMRSRERRHDREPARGRPATAADEHDRLGIGSRHVGVVHVVRDRDVFEMNGRHARDTARGAGVTLPVVRRGRAAG